MGPHKSDPDSLSRVVLGNMPEDDYDLSGINDKLLIFAKEYLKCGNARTAASAISASTDIRYLSCLGSTYLGKLRKEEWFLSSIGCGWDDFKEVAEQLRKNPYAFAGVFLKLHREDVSEVKVSDNKVIVNIIEPPTASQGALPKADSEEAGPDADD